VPGADELTVEVLLNGALLHVTSGDEIVDSITYIDGFVLGVIVRRNPCFRATLYRVWQRTFSAPPDLPETWSTFGVTDAICETIEDGRRLMRERVEALEDQDPVNYQFRKSLRTSWPTD
jgi:hypothetical protein